MIEIKDLTLNFRQQIKTLFHSIVLAFSIIGGALVGPISNIVPCKTLFLKQSWRFQSLFILMTVGLLLERLYNFVMENVESENKEKHC
tara:strand:+ start:374 stop:637 length:264 start_codon:yes stop_codon:yes gene_type:complete